MKPEQRLTLLARNVRLHTRKPSKEGLKEWQEKSKPVREAYLKEHPNSIYQDIKVNTLSERISKDENNKQVAQDATEALKAAGFKKKYSIKDRVQDLQAFLQGNKQKREERSAFGVNLMRGVLKKMSKQDRAEVKADAQAIVGDPRKKPSAILNQRSGKKLIVGLVGLGVCGALFGTGLVDPSIVAFVGIKAFDYGASKIATILDATPLDEFFMASVVHSFVTGKGGEEYGNSIWDRGKRAWGELTGNPVEKENEEEKDNEDGDEDLDKDDDLSQLEPATDKNGRDADRTHSDTDSDQQDTPEDMSSEVSLKKPTPEKLKSIKEDLEKTGIKVTVEKIPTQPGELQQSVKINLEDGDPGTFASAVTKLGLVSKKTLKPLNRDKIGQSVSGYLTK